MLLTDKTLILDGQTLTCKDLFEAVKDESIKVQIKDENWKKIEDCRGLCEKWAKQEQVIYGVNTSCGGLVNYLLPQGADNAFQNNLIRSITTQVGELFSDEIVRMTMIIRANSLCRGYSGIKPENLKIYLQMINKNVYPCIPVRGSLGASGDLGPLGCIACVAIGEWKARFKGQTLSGKQAMNKAGIPTMKLNAKEGLCLINGTSCMAALASEILIDSINIIKNSDIIASLSIETLLGRINPFDIRVHQLKAHPGQNATAKNLTLLLKDSLLMLDEQKVSSDLSKVLKNHRGVEVSDIPVEDAYSIRCTPQYIGPSRETILFSKQIIEREINSCNDNPLIFTEFNNFIHNGHFHGQYLSTAMDNICTAVIPFGIISDRRIDRFMDKNNSVGLPPFLCKENTGIRMGLMGGQFMTTSLVAENRCHAIPASIQSIPSTADFQDVVSLGLIAGRKVQQVITNTIYILAFELICGAQAADQRGIQNLSSAGKALYEATRETVPYLDYDTVIIDYIETLAERIKSGELVKRVEKTIGTSLELLAFNEYQFPQSEKQVVHQSEKQLV